MAAALEECAGGRPRYLRFFQTTFRPVGEMTREKRSEIRTNPNFEFGKLSTVKVGRWTPAGFDTAGPALSMQTVSGESSPAESHPCRRLPANSEFCRGFRPERRHRLDLPECDLRFCWGTPIYVDVCQRNQICAEVLIRNSGAGADSASPAHRAAGIRTTGPPGAMARRPPRGQGTGTPAATAGERRRRPKRPPVRYDSA